MPIAFFLGLAALILMFAEIAAEIAEAEGEVDWFDRGLLLAWRTADPADPISPRWFELAVADIRPMLSAATYLTLGAFLAHARGGGRR